MKKEIFVTYKVMQLPSCDSMGTKKCRTNVTLEFQPCHSEIHNQLLWDNSHLKQLVIAWEMNISL